jgi:hypothetical protein
VSKRREYRVESSRSRGPGGSGFHCSFGSLIAILTSRTYPPGEREREREREKERKRERERERERKREKERGREEGREEGRERERVRGRGRGRGRGRASERARERERERQTERERERSYHVKVSGISVLQRNIHIMYVCIYMGGDRRRVSYLCSSLCLKSWTPKDGLCTCHDLYSIRDSACTGRTYTVSKTVHTLVRETP